MLCPNCGTLTIMPNIDRFACLTRREKLIVARLCAGHQHKVIARALDRAPGTIRNQMHRIYGKLGVTNATELVALMMQDEATS